MSEVVRAACPHDCPDTCAMHVRVEDGRATAVTGDPDHPVTRGFLCGKVSNYLDRVYSDERVLHPLVREDGTLRQASWDEALDEVAARMGSEDFTWVAQAIAIQREVGGNLAEVLDTVGHTIRERNAIRRQVKALSAEGKLSAIVLMALPFGIVGFISMTNPGYLANFTESLIGYGMVAVAAVMMLVGALWLKKTVTIRF